MTWDSETVLKRAILGSQLDPNHRAARETIDVPVRRNEGRHGRGSVAQLHHQFRTAAPGGARCAASCARARWRGCAARRSSYWASPSRHREADRAQDLPAGATLFRPARLRRADESGTCLLPRSGEAPWHRGAQARSAIRVLYCEIGRLLSHLLNVTTQAMDVGALTPPLWGLRGTRETDGILRARLGCTHACQLFPGWRC